MGGNCLPTATFTFVALCLFCNEVLAQDIDSCPRVPRVEPKVDANCESSQRDFTMKNAQGSIGALNVYRLNTDRNPIGGVTLQPGQENIYENVCEGFQFYLEAEECSKCIEIFVVGNRSNQRVFRIKSDTCSSAPPTTRPTTRPRTRPTNEPSSTSLDKPNIIFIMGDDIGARDFEFLEGTKISTPVLNKLARDSVNFLSTWATPFCRTTRSVVMTGKLPFATGHFSQFELPPERLRPFGPSFGNLAKSAGYRTLFSGKWQIFGKARGSEADGGYGFDQYTIWGHSDVETFEDLAEKYDGPIPPPGGPMAGGPFLREWGRYSQPIIAKNDRFVDTDPLNFSSNIFLDHIQDFMRKNRDDGESSFVYFPMALAHDDWNFAKREMTWVPMPVLDNDGRVTGYQRGNPSFGKMVTYMDTIIGLLIDGLKRDNLYRDTIIFFCTDNGSPTSAESEPFKGRTTDERGVRVPMLVHGGGGRIATKATRAIFSLVDVYATLAGFMGVRGPSRPNSIDFSDFILGRSDEAPRKWMFSYHEEERMIRSREWIYDSAKTLFNCTSTTVVEDCEIVRNVAGNPAARIVRNKFDTILAELEDTGTSDGTKF